MSAAGSPDVRDVVELRDDSVQELGSCEPVLDLHLRGEMTEDDDGGLVFSRQDGPDKQLEMLEPLRVTGVSGGAVAGDRPYDP
jgi:hypothetical protein